MRKMPAILSELIFSFPKGKKKKVVCASPHNAFYCSPRNVEYGGGGCGCGGRTIHAHSVPWIEHSSPDCRGGKREDAFPQDSRCSWDQPEHHFMYNPLKWPFRDSGSRKHLRIFDSGLFSREGWVETASSSWALNRFHLNFSSSLGRKGVTWPERILNIPSARKGGRTRVLFVGSKQFSNKIGCCSLFLKPHYRTWLLELFKCVWHKYYFKRK